MTRIREEDLGRVNMSLACVVWWHYLGRVILTRSWPVWWRYLGRVNMSLACVMALFGTR